LLDPIKIKAAPIKLIFLKKSNYLYSDSLSIDLFLLIIHGLSFVANINEVAINNNIPPQYVYPVAINSPQKIKMAPSAFINYWLSYSYDIDEPNTLSDPNESGINYFLKACRYLS
jgi:hypothetical protein